MIGNVVPNRAIPGSRQVIGNFENILPVVLSIKDKTSFLEVLSVVCEQSVNGSLHYEVPFEELITQLDQTRDLSRSPICQILYAYRHRSYNLAHSLGAALIEPSLQLAGGSIADLSLKIDDRISSLALELEYSTDLFEAATAEYLLDRYVVLLEAILETPHKELADLPILCPRELAKLKEWNATDAAFSPQCAHELFDRQSTITPESVAIESDEESVTYAQLSSRANQVASMLAEMKIASNSLVGIYMKRSVNMVAALLGVWKAGAAYVPLDPDYPSERLSFIAADSGIQIVLTSPGLNPKQLDENLTAVCINFSGEIGLDVWSGSCPPKPSPDDLAYVIYTSGSTGRPKGVEIPHIAVSNFLQAMQQRPGISPTDTVLALTTLSFDIAVLEIFLPLSVGATVAMVSRDAAMDPNVLQQKIELWNPSVIQATPSTWRMLLDAGWPGRAGLSILVGGEALLPDLADALLDRCDRLWNMYGPTETTVWATISEVSRGKKIVIGEPISNVTAYIADANLKPVPIGVPGELCLGGVQLARGYRNRPELTGDKFVSDPRVPGKATRLYRTGDLARYLTDGRIEFLGRLDSQVKIRGHRIETGEIEAVLLEHPAIAQAVVVARDDGGGKRLVSYMVCVPGRQTVVDDLRAFLKRKLPEYMVPSTYVFLDSFPVTPNGKVNRLALPAPQTTPVGREMKEFPNCGWIEQRLIEIWMSELQAKVIGVDDDFFQLGGDSLLAVRIIVQIEKIFGVKLPLITFFQASTIQHLAQKLREQQRTPFSCLVPIRKQGSLPALFLVHGLGGNILGYRALVDNLDPDQPVYGLQAVGLDGVQSPLRSVKEMALRYVAEIRTCQPHGPYHIGGLSLGGVIALEIALQLQSAGEEVAALLMLDAYAFGVEKLDSALTRCRKTLLMLLQRARLHVANLAALDRAGKIDYIHRKSATLKRRVMWEVHTQHYKNFVRGFDYIPQSYNAVAHAAWEAMKEYVPVEYTGRVLVLRAKDEPFLRNDDPTLGWERLIKGNLAVCNVPGDHMNFLTTPHVKEVAKQVQLYLQSIRN